METLQTTLKQYGVEVDSDSLSAYLGEFMLRQRHGRTATDCFDNIYEHVLEWYVVWIKDDEGNIFIFAKTNVICMIVPLRCPKHNIARNGFYSDSRFVQHSKLGPYLVHKLSLSKCHCFPKENVTVSLKSTPFWQLLAAL